MKTKKYLLLFFLVALCFSDCKKYPDGPWFSFRSKDARIIGNWTVESYLINNVDSISKFICTDCSFKHKGRSYIVGSDCLGDGGWDLRNHKKEIWIYFQWQTGYPIPKGPFPVTDFDSTWTHSSLSWEIQRLTTTQMWLKVNFNSKEYYIKFKS
jgi:hypothetical protein